MFETEKFREIEDVNARRAKKVFLHYDSFNYADYDLSSDAAN